MKEKRQNWKKVRQMKVLYLFLAFPAIFLIVFEYAPMYGIVIAFKNFRFSDGIMGSVWNDFAHFKLLMRDVLFKRAFINTIRISLARIAVTFPAPILFALLLNELKGGRFKKAVQTISYLPHFLSWVIIAGFVRQILSPEYGIVNLIITRLGGEAQYFLGEKEAFLPILLISSLWAGIGWGSIIYLAAISGVDQELYEASALDGATRLHQALYVTIPSIAPVIAIQFILSFRNVMKGGFDAIFNLYNGLTMETADIIETYTYRVGLAGGRYDYSTAIGLFQNLIGLAMVLVVNRIIKRLSSDYAIW
jgi:putative aldouronate transport system permease protein